MKRESLLQQKIRKVRARIERKVAEVSYNDLVEVDRLLTTQVAVHVERRKQAAREKALRDSPPVCNCSCFHCVATRTKLAREAKKGTVPRGRPRKKAPAKKAKK